MKLQTWCTALVIAGAAARPSSLAAQRSAGVPPYSYVVASFAGQHQGRFPAANCSPSSLQGSMALAEFAETTPANAPAGFGSFDMQLSGACVTPFFQALFAREPMTVVATFVAADGTPTMAYAMKNAQLTHVKLFETGPVVYLELSIAAPQVAVTKGDASSSVTDPAPSSGPSQSTAFGKRKVNSSSLERVRVPTFHLPLDQLRKVRPLRISGVAAASAPPAAPSGVGDSWLPSGPRSNGGLIFTAKLSVFDLNIKSALALDAGYAIDASSHMPTGGLQLSLSPLQLATNSTALMTQLGNAAQTHAVLQPGELVVRRPDGSPCITISLQSGRLLSYQQLASSGGSNGLPSQSLQLGFGGLTISDIGSGKTAQSQP